MRKLTDGQARVLARLSREPGEGWMLNAWIAQACGHPYQPAWAGSKVKALAERGYIEIGGGGYSRITDAGRAALAPNTTEGRTDRAG